MFEQIKTLLEESHECTSKQFSEIITRLERIEQHMQIEDTQFQALTAGITQMTTDQQAANAQILADVQKIAGELTAATGTPTDISSTIAAITASDDAAKALASQVDAIVNPAPAPPAPPAV